MHDVLIDQNGFKLADVEYERSNGLFVGVLTNMNLPESLRALCLEIDDCCNQNSFSGLAKIEEQIEAFGLRLEKAQKELILFQVMNGNDVSFSFKD